MPRSIDINCDMGESFGPWTMGNDEALMPFITSANIACGYHAGDPLVMDHTVRLALSYGVAPGAHPGFPDIMGFGRRPMKLSADEAENYVLYQVSALYGFARSYGARLQHVKAHGALYNMAAEDLDLALAIARAVKRFDPELILLGLAGSRLVEAARSMGLKVAREAFADRRYNPDGTLQSRRVQGSLITDPEEAAAQALSIATTGIVLAHDGTRVHVEADSICIHGDTPTAPEIARRVRQKLQEAGLSVVPLAHFIR
jgi:UPF0271 protein